MIAWLGFAVGAYLIGSVPFGLLIGKAQGVDIREHGSGNIGATNLGRVLGRRFFFICFFLDMSKGLAPTLLSGSLMGTLGHLAIGSGDAWGWLLVMSSAVLGHIFSPWLGFKGGKGVATALGAMLGVFPAMTIPAVGALVVFLVVVALWRYISAASCMAALTLPVWTWYTFEQYRTRELIGVRQNPQWRDLPTAEIEATIPHHGTPFIVVAVALAVLVIYKHRANIARLAQGTEPTIHGTTRNQGNAESADGENSPSAGGNP